MGKILKILDIFPAIKSKIISIYYAGYFFHPCAMEKLFTHGHMALFSEAIRSLFQKEYIYIYIYRSIYKSIYIYRSLYRSSDTVMLNLTVIEIYINLSIKIH
jgi:hypothetical protein